MLHVVTCAMFVLRQLGVLATGVRPLMPNARTSAACRALRQAAPQRLLLFHVSDYILLPPLPTVTTVSY
jgi:hypothetical protein